MPEYQRNQIQMNKYQQKFKEVLRQIVGVQYSVENEYELCERLECLARQNAHHQFRVCINNNPDENYQFQFQMIVCGRCGDFVMCMGLINCSCEMV